MLQFYGKTMSIRYFLRVDKKIFLYFFALLNGMKGRCLFSELMCQVFELQFVMCVCIVRLYKEWSLLRVWLRSFWVSFLLCYRKYFEYRPFFSQLFFVSLLGFKFNTMQLP